MEKLNLLKEIETCKQSINCSPDNFKLHLHLGTSYCKMGQWQKAIDAYKQTIRINPDYAIAYGNLGVAYYKLGCENKVLNKSTIEYWLEAIKSYEEAIKLKSDYAEAYYNLGIIYSRLGSHQSATESFRLAVKFKPDYADDKHFQQMLTGPAQNNQQQIKNKQAIQEIETVKDLPDFKNQYCIDSCIRNSN